MLKLNRVRVLATVASLTLLPGMLLAAPGDNDSGRSHRNRRVEKKVERRVERRVERLNERTREFLHDTPRRVVCEEPIRHRHNGRGTLACGCVEVVRPGYYKTVVERVRSAGHYERVWVRGPKLRFDGCVIEVGVRSGHYENRYVPGRMQKVERQVWVPAERVIEKRCRKHGRRHGH